MEQIERQLTQCAQLKWTSQNWMRSAQEDKNRGYCLKCYWPIAIHAIHTAVAVVVAVAAAATSNTTQIHICLYYSVIFLVFCIRFIPFCVHIRFVSFINIISQQSHNVFSIKKNEVSCKTLYAFTNIQIQITHTCRTPYSVF